MTCLRILSRCLSAFEVLRSRQRRRLTLIVVTKEVEKDARKLANPKKLTPNLPNKNSFTDPHPVKYRMLTLVICNLIEDGALEMVGDLSGGEKAAALELPNHLSGSTLYKIAYYQSEHNILLPVLL